MEIRNTRKVKLSLPIKIFLSWSLISCQGKISKSSENLTKVVVAKIIVQIPCSPSPPLPSPHTPSLSSLTPSVLCSLSPSLTLSHLQLSRLSIFLSFPNAWSQVFDFTLPPHPPPRGQSCDHLSSRMDRPLSQEDKPKRIGPGSFPSKSWLIRILGSNSWERSKATPDLNFVVRYQTWFGTTPCQAGSTGKAHFIGQCHIAALLVKGARVRNSVCSTTNVTVVQVIDN